jgi:stearoyl-CoA desaturase (delta-9 desaturase)
MPRGSNTPSIIASEGQQRISLRMRRIVRQLFPVMGVVVAIYQVIARQVTPLDFALFGGMYIITMFGFEAGFHRYFSHGAFRAGPTAKNFLGISGTMFGAGSILWWATMHRVHHRCADQPGDPHSPLLHGVAPLQRLQGWWHAYSGFLMNPLDYDPARYCPDLMHDPSVVRMSNDSFMWYCVGIVGPGVIALVITGSWAAFASGIIWGGLARIFCGRFASLSVQCFCHVWGSRPYRTPGQDDNARNNVLFVPASLGMGWHNNHHAFPYTYSNCFAWWQIDPAAWGLRAMRFIGLIDELKFPTPAALAASRNQSAKPWWYA